MNTTQENNRLIAEFMGGKDQSRLIGGANEILFESPSYGGSKPSKVYTPFTSLKYHTSWDWLMPVGAKCLEKSLSLRQYPFIDIKIKEAVQTFEIEATYQAVVEFIEWYNKQSIS